MNLTELKKLVAHDETRTLELKTSTGELTRGLETACAFLNSDGGWLVFGVTPKLRIIGQNVTDSTKQEIAQGLRKIEPAVDVSVQYIELPDKPGFFVIALYFDPTNFKNGPYSFDGRAFYKVESSTMLMPRSMYEERLRLSNPHRFSWENTPNPDLQVSDIDEELLYQTLHDGIGVRRIPASTMTLHEPLSIMQKLGVARQDGLLLNAANVLFGNNPTLYHPQCRVRLARFEGRDKRVFRDQTVCEGNLFRQYDAVMDFCLKHLNMGGVMNRRKRKDILTVPYEALKEAAVNMLCHRSWSAENATPSLAIYDDRMVYQNPGSLPEGTTWQDFAEERAGSIPANPTIASVFYRRGTMEAWGRGINLIVSSCREAGLPVPEVQIVASFINLTIRFAHPLGSQRSDKCPPHDGAKSPHDGGAKSPHDDGVKSPHDGAKSPHDGAKSPHDGAKSPHDGFTGGDIVALILRYCATPRSLAEIAEHLHMKDTKWLRKRYITPLLGNGLSLTIPDKPRSKMQRYEARDHGAR